MFEQLFGQKFLNVACRGCMACRNNSSASLHTASTLTVFRCRLIGRIHHTTASTLTVFRCRSIRRIHHAHYSLHTHHAHYSLHTITRPHAFTNNSPLPFASLIASCIRGSCTSCLHVFLLPRARSSSFSSLSRSAWTWSRSAWASARRTWT